MHSDKQQGEHVLWELKPLAPAFISEVKGPRPRLQVSLSLKMRSLMSFCEFSKRLVLWPSGIVEISVSGMRVQVRTEGILAYHCVVRAWKSWVCWRLACTEMHLWIHLTRRSREGVTSLAPCRIPPGSILACLVMNMIFTQTVKSYTLDFTLCEYA